VRNKQKRLRRNLHAIKVELRDALRDGIPLLLNLLNDASFYVRYPAASALVKLADNSES
jgi:HEAT repeat protein